VLLSDGEAWSGEVSGAVNRTLQRGIPIHVVGVGTLGGGRLPVVRTAAGELLESPGMSRLERGSLQRIAAAGGGDYFELDRDGDRHIANSIISAGRRRASAAGVQEVSEDLYWWFIVAAAAVAAAGLLLIRQRFALGILLAGSVAGAVMVGPVLW
jgi:hypothetical protein